MFHLYKIRTLSSSKSNMLRSFATPSQGSNAHRRCTRGRPAMEVKGRGEAATDFIPIQFFIGVVCCLFWVILLAVSISFSFVLLFFCDMSQFYWTEKWLITERKIIRVIHSKLPFFRLWLRASLQTNSWENRHKYNTIESCGHSVW